MSCQNVTLEVKLGQYKKIELSNNTVKEKEEELIQQIIANSKFIIPGGSIEEVAAKMSEEFAKRLIQQGLSIEQYYTVSGLNASQLLKQMMPIAEKRVKGRMVLEAIAKEEHLEATKEEYDREIRRLSSKYLATENEIKKLVMGKEEIQIKTDIVIQKALEFVLKSAFEKKKI